MYHTNWQDFLYYLTRRAKVDGILKEVQKLTDQEDVVNFLMKTPYYRKMLLDWINTSIKPDDHRKSSDKAASFRQRGNDKFLNQDNEGSFLMYNESVRYAGYNGQELALAYANRSASLYHMGHLLECLQDISYALQSGYPLRLHYKLYMRIGKCYMKLGRFQEAIDALQMAKDYTKQIEDASASKKSSIENNIEKVLHSALSQLRMGSNLNHSTPSLDLPRPTYGESEKFAYASEALDLKFNKDKGRHVIANRDVKRGDILFVEKPFALVLLPEHYGKHCHHCVKTFVASIPCKDCIDALYCSIACRNESWEQYHEWECHGALELLHGIGIAHLGLRVVLKAGEPDLIRKSIDNNWLPQTVYGNKGDNYYAVYRLMPHLEDMQPEDHFQYSLTAALLALYLEKHCRYFEHNVHCSLKESHGILNFCCNCEKNASFVGGLLLRHIGQLVCNGHAITKLDTSAPDQRYCGIATESQVRIATAIYPSASMMNHSCDPNIINSFFDQHLVVRSYKNILKGGEVYNCYGPHFRRMSRQGRLEALKCQYFFNCTCHHCLHPVQRCDFQDRFSGFLCSTCGGPLVRNKTNNAPAYDSHLMVCCDCGTSHPSGNMEERALTARAIYEKGCTVLEMGNVKEAINQFQICLKLWNECLYKNNTELMTCKDQIAKCYSMLGDYSKSVEYLLQSIPAVKEQFGSHSIELANELQKLSDVMIRDLKRESKENVNSFNEKRDRAFDCVSQAKQLLELHYGLWNSGLQEIIEKEKWLKSLDKKET